MRDTITIVYDAANGTHLITVWQVSEGKPGEKEVGTSTLQHHHVGGNEGTTIDGMWRNAALLVGIPNVQVIQGTLWEPTGEMVAEVSEVLSSRKTLRPDPNPCQDSSLLNR